MMTYCIDDLLVTRKFSEIILREHFPRTFSEDILRGHSQHVYGNSQWSVSIYLRLYFLCFKDLMSVCRTEAVQVMNCGLWQIACWKCHEGKKSTAKDGSQRREGMWKKIARRESKRVKWVKTVINEFEDEELTNSWVRWKQKHLSRKKPCKIRQKTSKK